MTLVNKARHWKDFNEDVIGLNDLFETLNNFTDEFKEGTYSKEEIIKKIKKHFVNEGDL